jgi:hypothetical protein
MRVKTVLERCGIYAFDFFIKNRRETPVLVTKDSQCSKFRDSVVLPEKWESLSHRVGAMLVVYNV